MKLSVLALALTAVVVSGQAQRKPAFDRVYPLAPAEGVFAYARISPDGRHLVYASEVRDSARPRVVRQTVTLVDLTTRKVLFTEPGIDAYFSTDGQRMIYLSFRDGGSSVSLRDQRTGAITRDIAPARLGDYFSWGKRDGRDLILTINSNYYYLDGNRAELPASRVPPCDGIGVGERPLLSRDGRRITTFVRGTVVVRDLTDCDYVLDTGIRGAKADFSWDGRYIAFHAPKTDGRGYDIQVVDLQRRTVRTVTDLPGSSLFPSWTRDGRLSFRYDGDDYRGFVMASNVLSAPPRPLPATLGRIPASRSWSDVFPDVARPQHGLTLVIVWSTWSAHTPMALAAAEQARRYFSRQSLDVAVTTAVEPGSLTSDVERLVATHDVRLPRMALAPERLALTEAHNQIPATLLFRGDRLVDRRLGAQTFEELRDWVVAAGPSTAAGGQRR